MLSEHGSHCLSLFLFFQGMSQLRKIKASRRASQKKLMALLNEYDYYDYTSTSSAESDDSFWLLYHDRHTSSDEYDSDDPLREGR